MRILALIFATLLQISASAAPVTYSIQHRVTATEGDCAGAAPGSGRWGCMSVGDIQYGEITFDDSVLVTDGRIDDIGPFSFWLQFGLMSYSNMNGAVAMFRNQYGFAASPTLVVEGGKLVDLIGDVYSVGDAPYVDWNFMEPAKSFFANDYANYRVSGVLAVSQVPEPSSLVLLVVGGAALLLARRRGKLRSEVDSGRYSEFALRERQ